MTNVNSTDAAAFTQTTNMAYQNPYMTSSQTTMGNDYFGSQVFGGNYNQSVQNSVQEQPQQQAIAGSGTLASNIFQEFLAAQNGSSKQLQTTPFPPQTAPTTGRTPTVQDYYMASQVANMFAGNTPLIYKNTNFTDTDFFAQQLFNPANTQGIDYSA